jgi:hypothetical protein
VISVISKLYPEGLLETDFSRPPLFYSLFTTVAHCLFGFSGMAEKQFDLKKESAVQHARNRLDRVAEIFQMEDVSLLAKTEQQFIQDSRRATTDEKVRQRRTKFLLDLLA